MTIFLKNCLVIFGFLFTGPKPSELFGRYTWKIEKFSQINKRELRSSPFEVGGYKWYEVYHWTYIAFVVI